MRANRGPEANICSGAPCPINEAVGWPTLHPFKFDHVEENKKVRFWLFIPVFLFS